MIEQIEVDYIVVGAGSAGYAIMVFATRSS